MLIEFTDDNGTPLYINPQYVIAVREQKHSGRPGIGSDAEYRDTLVLTTIHQFNVRDQPDAVVRQLNHASLEMLQALKPAGAGIDPVLPPDEEPG